MRKKSSKLFLYITLGIFSLMLFLMFFIELKLVMTLGFTVILITSYIFYKKKIGQELIIALLFAIGITSYYTYEYTSANLLFGKINLFPLVSWTFGLVLVRELYEHLHDKYRFLLTCIIYWAGLFTVEYLGYHFWNIRLNSNYPSFLGLGFMHAQVGMKAFYVLAAPVYLAITDYLKVK